MPSRHAVLLASSKPSAILPLLSCKYTAPVTHLDATLTKKSVSIDSKEFAEHVSPLSATLTKNRGRGGANRFNSRKLYGINEPSPRMPGPSPPDRNAALHRA